MKCSNGFMAEAYRLSQSTSNPQRVYTAIRHTMRMTIRLLQASSVVNLLERLINRGLSTTPVATMCRNACRGLSDEKPRIIGAQLMKWKVIDARSVLKHRKRENTKVWRENEKVLRQFRVCEDFFVIWEREKSERRRELDDKRERKIRFLFEKEKREKERRQNGSTRRVRGRVTDWTVRGINCGDRQLNDTFESRARVYGSASVSNSEHSVLELSPKFAVYDEVDELEIEVEVEKALTKLRLGRMNSDWIAC